MQRTSAVPTTPPAQTAMQRRGLCKLKVCFPAWGIKGLDLGPADWVQQRGPTGPQLLSVSGNSVGGFLSAKPQFGWAATVAHCSNI